MNRLHVEVARRVVQLAGAAERKALFDYDELMRLPEVERESPWDLLESHKRLPMSGLRLSRTAHATNNLRRRVETAQSVSRRALALFEAVGGVVDWMPDANT
jgi:hypothetical protein